ncbi:MAG: hypothetical protein V3V01_01355 [Acidimicrobiales bacterium]
MCPPAAAWGEGFSVYVEVDSITAASGFRIVQPDPSGGHLSAGLISAVSQGERVDPSLDGLWMITVDLERASHKLTAVCANAAGIEHGVVHYGDVSVEL